MPSLSFTKRNMLVGRYVWGRWFALLFVCCAAQSLGWIFRGGQRLKHTISWGIAQNIGWTCNGFVLVATSRPIASNWPHCPKAGLVSKAEREDSPLAFLKPGSGAGISSDSPVAGCTRRVAKECSRCPVKPGSTLPP